MAPSQWIAGILGATALVALVLTAATTHSAPEELLMASPQHTEKLFLGEYWTINGLKDDGKFMVPAVPADRSSGNALFDFGRMDGTATDMETGMPDMDLSRVGG
ncbi:hypothetical protein T484DRAFT_1780407 [Baffinella frigidus]|nr:hypothetical protein T484DRAFT_1780407 [Cryptophyta sp. CCMP2293]